MHLYNYIESHAHLIISFLYFSSCFLPSLLTNLCNIFVKPHTSFLSSVLQGGPVEHRVTKGIILQNQTLVLQNIRREAAGLYTCAAVNIEGEGESQPVNLRVKCESKLFMQPSSGDFLGEK